MPPALPCTFPTHPNTTRPSGSRWPNPPAPRAWPGTPDRAAPGRAGALAALLLGLAGLSALGGCAGQPPAPALPVAAQPEGASGWQAKPGWSTRRDAVAAAHPLATDAGYRVLRAGGSAMDAAIAVQLVLGLVEPQSSGIGGGAFLLHADGSAVEAWDGRETAPAAANGRLFLRPDGQPMPFREAVVGGRAVGVPGVMRLLEAAHRRHGRLPWADLFAPAIALAEGGFPVSPRLHTLLAAETALARDPRAAAYFYDPAGRPWPVGHVLRNPEYAAVLRELATHGATALHEGPLAQAIVDTVQGHASNPGRLSLADLAAYRPRQREPLCHDWQPAGRALRICGFPPPGSGALAIGQILGLLARTPADQLPLQGGPDNPLPPPAWLHLYSEAARLAFADRARHVADPDFVAPPPGGWSALLAPDYLARRARLIDTSPGAPVMREAPAGQPGPAGTGPTAWAPMPEQPEAGTSHLSIVDAQGRAVAMTTTVEDAFGARLMVNRGRGLTGGFLLNNQLTDFSFTPADARGQPVANRVEPGKRPRSSMAPTLVFDARDGRLLLNTGSPGGAFIIHYTAKTLYGILQWGLGPQQAVGLPNFAQTGGPLLLEAGRFPAATAQALRERGGEVREQALTSGLQALQRAPSGGWLGGADPRREGIVMGD